MATPEQPQKAYLLPEDAAEKIECWFNPKDYAISKSNTWKMDEVVGTGLPKAQFTGGKSQQITLDLMFDAWDGGRDDVRPVTDRLFGLMDVEQKHATGKNTARPPTVTFGWGETISFKAVVTQLAVQFTMFRPNGVPVRAQAKLTLMQVEEAVGGGKGKTPLSAKKQNPTTTGVAGLASHVVRDGDSLQSIAWRTYGDASQWRAIAQANGIDDPLRLERGRALSVPRLET